MRSVHGHSRRRRRSALRSLGRSEVGVRDSHNLKTGGMTQAVNTDDTNMRLRLIAHLASWLLSVLPMAAQAAPTAVRVGYFPNVTHSQALVGRARGDFEKSLGPAVRVEWKAFNAGPS